VGPIRKIAGGNSLGMMNDQDRIFELPRCQEKEFFKNKKRGVLGG
jgi:hypothetical protein